MNKNIISRCCIIWLLSSTIAANAQVQLSDIKIDKVDLGFGIQHSKLLNTASTYTITAEELQQTSAVNLSEALYGKLLGLTALKSGGFVGDENAGASFNIRGYQTLSDKSILILVDGYERPIDRLSVEEVESVTVLKDAAAVSMLGVEGINGAIIVKTKRGSIGKTKIKVGYSHKFTFDPEFADMIDGYGYAKALNKARSNDGLTPAYDDSELKLIESGNDPLFYPNVNWKKEAFKDMGSEDRANLSVFGGNERMKYYTMLDYTNGTGLLNNTKQKDYSSQLKYSKANIRGNVDLILTPTTSISADALGIFIETGRPNDVDANGATWYIYKTPAIAFPLRTSSGYWGGNETYGDGNIAAKIQESGFEKSHQRQLWANAKLKQDLGFWIPGLTLQMGIGYDNSSLTYEQRKKGHQYAYEYYTGTVGDKNNVNEVVMGNKENNLNFSHWVDTQWRSCQTYIGLYYNRSLRDDDHFAASASYGTKSEIRDGQGNTFYRVNWTGTAHYDLMDKYVADLTLAANGSNRSYPAKWSFSPTIALGYIFANDETSILNYGKIRGSFGIQHTDCVPKAGLWLSSWNTSNGQFYYGQANSSSWGSFITSFPTTDFQQEKATKFNIGTDLRLWNMVDINADIYYQYRNHILVTANDKNSWVVGIQSAYEDLGSIKSYGMEIGARLAKKIGKNLYINATGLFSVNRNKIDNTIESPAFKNQSAIGKRVDEAWGLEAEGFFKDQHDIDNSARQEFSQLRPGDIKYKDQNGDNVINEFDYVGLGHGTGVPAMNYSFSFGLEYKNLGFNAVMQGAGNQMKNIYYVDGVWNVIADNKNMSTYYYDNCWDVKGDDALYPRLTSQNIPNNTHPSSIWFKNINFLKLRNCEVYYKLPKSVLQKMNICAAKLFVQGENLLSFDNVEAMDAEVLSTSYPVLKSVNVGLSVTF